MDADKLQEMREKVLKADELRKGMSNLQDKIRHVREAPGFAFHRTQANASAWRLMKEPGEAGWGLGGIPGDFAREMIEEIRSKLVKHYSDHLNKLTAEFESL